MTSSKKNKEENKKCIEHMISPPQIAGIVIGSILFIIIIICAVLGYYFILKPKWYPPLNSLQTQGISEVSAQPQAPVQ